MAALTNAEIEQLKQQLKEKTEEIRVIYDKLIEAGAVEVPDDFLDGVAGGSSYDPYDTYDPHYDPDRYYRKHHK